MQFLDGGGHRAGDMNGPELRMVVDHFNQFGQPYANAFLNAVPEPTTAVLRNVWWIELASSSA